MDPQEVFSEFLDTGILVHLIRGDSLGQRIRETRSPLMANPRPLISDVSEGELRSLAYQWNWGPDRMSQVEFLLGYFDRAHIDSPGILEAYAVIDSFSLANGRIMGKNDVWIAATAHVTGRRLLTTDSDYDHLHGLFLIRDYVRFG